MKQDCNKQVLKQAPGTSFNLNTMKCKTLNIWYTMLVLKVNHFIFYKFECLDSRINSTVRQSCQKGNFGNLNFQGGKQGKEKDRSSATKRVYVQHASEDQTVIDDYFICSPPAKRQKSTQSSFVDEETCNFIVRCKDSQAFNRLLGILQPLVFFSFFSGDQPLFCGATGALCFRLRMTLATHGIQIHSGCTICNTLLGFWLIW